MDEKRLKEIKDFCADCCCYHDSDSMCVPFEVRPTGRLAANRKEQIRLELIAEVQQLKEKEIKLKANIEYLKCCENCYTGNEILSNEEYKKQCGSCVGQDGCYGTEDNWQKFERSEDWCRHNPIWSDLEEVD